MTDAEIRVALDKEYNAHRSKLDSLELLLKSVQESITTEHRRHDGDRRKIEDHCKHVDDGGMFYFTCKKCGFSDGH